MNCLKTLTNCLSMNSWFYSAIKGSLLKWCRFRRLQLSWVESATGPFEAGAASPGLICSHDVREGGRETGWDSRCARGREQLAFASHRLYPCQLFTAFLAGLVGESVQCWKGLFIALRAGARPSFSARILWPGFAFSFISAAITGT